MRIIVLSDIHANLIALKAVLEVAGAADAFWCLGDVVGYGPHPNECVELVRNLPNLVCLAGNHDVAAAGKISFSRFNPEASALLSWTQDHLTQESLRWLRTLPETHAWGDWFLAHGSPVNPIWEYVMDRRSALAAFQANPAPFILVGHTHQALMYTSQRVDMFPEARYPYLDEAIPLQPRMVINPGSVGQPRDRDPRASFLVLDTEEETLSFSRVEYDIPAVQEAMRQHAMPHRMINRLSDGW